MVCYMSCFKSCILLIKNDAHCAGNFPFPVFVAKSVFLNYLFWQLLLIILKKVLECLFLFHIS